MTGTDYPPTYWDLIAATAREHPDQRVLLDDHDRTLTACELHDRAEECAAGLHARGICAGTVVSWQLPTTLEAMVVMAALARLGAVQNPVITMLRETELTFITEQLGTEHFLVPRTWREFDHAGLADALAARTGLSVLIVDHDTDPRSLGGGLRLDLGDPATLPPPPGPDATAARWIYYSSGTTAAPKGVRHADRSVMAGSAGVVGMVGASSTDVNPIAFPVTHIGGAAMLAASLLSGMQLALFEAFDPVESPLRFAARGVTLLGSATPFYLAFLEAQRRHGDTPLFPRLRACLGGGAPITPDLQRRVREVLHMPGVANAWGLTEFPVATSAPPDGSPEVLDHTVGLPVPGVQVRTVDGELRLKGPQCFLGYVDASLDADAFDEDGWFRTGDLGSVDADGNVRITGRLKDVIIRNAENITAQEVEGVVASYPGVVDVAVIGVPDARTGERVCAVVVCGPGVAVPDLGELGAHCSAQGLARFKHPERIEVVDVLPRNLAGKVVKRELQARFS